MNSLSYLLLSFLLLLSCRTAENLPHEEASTDNKSAQVTGVSVSGSANSYTFKVTIKSPDTGCDQYADWWEIITPDESLLYRRILTHSHVNEQPFTRSGGPVAIGENTEVIVRAHMNNLGYGPQVFKGSVGSGFARDELPVDFGVELEKTEPLPDSCRF